jgi:CTP-dependent riboflavin kinase
MENNSKVKIEGIVKKGCGGSSRWMLTYIPWLFPGTLNLKLKNKKPAISWVQIIDTHYKKPCKIAPCKINGVDAFIIFPPLAKEHEFKIEIGAFFKIREKFNLQDGSQVIVEFI